MEDGGCPNQKGCYQRLFLLVPRAHPEPAYSLQVDVSVKAFDKDMGWYRRSEGPVSVGIQVEAVREYAQSTDAGLW